MGKKIELTEKQLDWLMTHYSDTKNQDICERFNISKWTLLLIRKQYNLSKSEEFIAKCGKENFGKALKAQKAKGYPNQINLRIHSQKAIENAQKTISERRKDEEFCKQWRKNLSKGIKETWEKERRRVLFGFDQKTKLRVVKTPQQKISLKVNLRKHGYEIEKGSNIAYINDNTKQSALMEKRGVIMGIKFIKKQM